MQRVMLIALLLCFVAFGVALSSYPPEIQAILDKEATGQVSAAEKAMVHNYFDGLYSKAINPVDSTWGPDGWGYIARDHTSGGEAFNWIDISATGTEIWGGQNQDDTWSGDIPLPFGFPFYGMTVNSFRLSANVIMAMSTGNPSYSTAVPSATQPARIDPWCYDMYHLGTDTLQGSHYYYQAFGDSMFVVSFIQARYYTSTYRNDPTYGKDMQVILKSDGFIKIQYDSVRTIYNVNNSGIDDDRGPNGLSHGQGMYDGLAVSYYYEPAIAGIELTGGAVSPDTNNTAMTYTYSITARIANGLAPDSALVIIDGVPTAMPDPGGFYAHGVTFTYETLLGAGDHTYSFRFVQDTTIATMPDTGTFAGPYVYAPALTGNYDIGGGNNDFPTIVAAVDCMYQGGLGGPVTLNVYPGIYDGWINVDGSMVFGMGANNPLVFNGMPTTEDPVIVRNTTGTGSTNGFAFYLRAAQYVTIQNFEIDSCDYGGIKFYYSGSDSTKYCNIYNNYIHDVGLSGSRYAMYLYRARYSEVIGNEVDGDYYGIYDYYGVENYVVNNMIYNAGYYGIYAGRGQGSEYYYNSVLSAGYGIRSYYGNCTTYKNNILYTTSTSTSRYAFYLYGDLTTYPVTSDYNCFYAPTATPFYYNGAITTLADWQTATGLDMNSMVADPLFNSLTDTPDLHIQTAVLSPVNAAGTPIAGITDDFDGDIRDLTTPDIGCDEFTPQIASYCLLLEPETLTANGPAGTNVDYYYCVTNQGSSADVALLSVIGATWTATVYDSAGANVITQTSQLAAMGGSEWVMVRHEIPGTATPGSSDTGTLIATSQGSAAVADSSTFTTTVVFPPLSGSYDIGGGNNDFPTIVDAAATLNNVGVSGPVVFNVYYATYTGLIQIDPILGASNVNTVTFCGVPGPNMPVVTNPTDDGFFLNGASFITIQGLEFTACGGNGGIYTDYNTTSGDSASYIIVDGCYFHDQAGSYQHYSYRSHHMTFRNNEFAGGGYGMRVRYCPNTEAYNNMIYGQTTSGLYSHNTPASVYHYNSIFDESNYTLRIGTNADDNIVTNNIAYNYDVSASYGCVFYQAAPTLHDYNNFYAPNGAPIARYISTTCATLLELQTASGQEANSISADPMFVDSTDLHIQAGSPCIAAGTPVAGITDDFDGDLRDANTPCMGCDEIVVTGLQVTLTPHNPPIQIPAGGGSFSFDAEIYNAGDSATIFDGWTEVVIPTGATVGPLVLRTNLPINPGQTIMRIVTQFVPRGAPVGNYTYIGNAGTHPGVIEDSDSFTFEKLAGDAPPSHNLGWAVFGWFGDDSDLSQFIPNEYDLANIYPNPFNPTTKIEYHMKDAAKASLVVYDILGREVARLVDGWAPMGVHYTTFDASGLSSGVYFAVFRTEGFNKAQKMLLVK